MQTSVDICNMALAQINVRSITSELDNTEEARQCKAMYPFCLAQVLAMADWNFCKVKRKLPKLEIEWIDEGYLPLERENYFKYPVDAVKILKVELSMRLRPILKGKHSKLHEAFSLEHDELYHHRQPDYAGKSTEEAAETEAEETSEEYNYKDHLPMLPIRHRVLPPKNDDGYELRSIKLLHQYYFTEVIVTQFNSVTAEYIRFEDNPQFWPPLFKDAVVNYLAMKLAPVLSGKSDAMQTASQLFQTSYALAKATNNNERKHTLHQPATIYRGCY